MQFKWSHYDVIDTRDPETEKNFKVLTKGMDEFLKSMNIDPRDEDQARAVIAGILFSSVHVDPEGEAPVQAQFKYLCALLAKRFAKHEVQDLQQMARDAATIQAEFGL